VMSSATSAVTYTSVYTDSEPGRAFWGADDEEVSKGGIPRVIVLGYDGLPIQPVVPLSSDYISGPEDPQTPPTGGDDGDDDDGNSSRDDADDDEEEEEHLAPADSAIVVPIDESVFPPEGTEPVIPPPSTDITIGARITVRPQASISLLLEAEVERLLAMTTPSPSPLISLSPPFVGECLVRSMAPPAHASPPPMPSPLLPLSRFTSALPSPPLPPLPPSLYIPPPVDRRDDIPKSEQPPRKRLYLSTLGSRYEAGESSTARPTRGRGINYGFVSTIDAEERRQGTRDVGYGIRDTWVDPTELKQFWSR
ncbi:hypothetical protein Tco_1179064, partial [Tanacetum coccineum]